MIFGHGFPSRSWFIVAVYVELWRIRSDHHYRSRPANLRYRTPGHAKRRRLSPNVGHSRVLSLRFKPVIRLVMRAQSDSQIDIVRPYLPSDRNDCLSIFDGNVPRFFSPTERGDYLNFLDREAVAWSYQVIERCDRVVACGGHVIDRDGSSASLCWGMVARSQHGTGLGSLLTAARLRAARTTPGVKQVRLDTSQHTQGFYRRFGFTVEKIVSDGYGPGLDRWEMMLHF